MFFFDNLDINDNDQIIEDASDNNPVDENSNIPDNPMYYDVDGDGKMDTILIDTDHDGIADTGYSDFNHDGVVDTVFSDENHDGVIDEIHMDRDGDKIFETNVDDVNEIMSLQNNLEYISNPTVENDYDIQSSLHLSHDTQFDSNQGIWYPPTFDPESGDMGVIGDPSEAMEHWHMQTNPDTCAVVSQEFILEELTGKQFDENELRDVAIENGWYVPGGGTSLENVGNLLEYYGMNVEKHDGSSINEIERALSDGDKVIVGLRSEDIWIPGQSEFEHAMNEIQGIPSSDANHAVEVIGIDKSDSDNPMVILNDPGHPGGDGSMIPLSEFEVAWSDSNNFIVTASN